MSKSFPHPDDPSLIIKPNQLRDPNGSWLDSIVSGVITTAAASAFMVAFLIIVGAVVSITVGKDDFHSNIVYLAAVGAYLAFITVLMIIYARTIKLPPYVPRWQVQKEEKFEDPYDQFKYGGNP